MSDRTEEITSLPRFFPDALADTEKFLDLLQNHQCLHQPLSSENPASLDNAMTAATRCRDHIRGMRRGDTVETDMYGVELYRAWVTAASELLESPHIPKYEAECRGCDKEITRETSLPNSVPTGQAMRKQLEGLKTMKDGLLTLEKEYWVCRTSNHVLSWGQKGDKADPSEAKLESIFEEIRGLVSTIRVDCDPKQVEELGYKMLMTTFLQGDFRQRSDRVLRDVRRHTHAASATSETCINFEGCQQVEQRLGIVTRSYQEYSSSMKDLPAAIKEPRKGFYKSLQAFKQCFKKLGESSVEADCQHVAQHAMATACDLLALYQGHILHATELIQPSVTFEAITKFGETLTSDERIYLRQIFIDDLRAAEAEGKM